MYIVPKNVYRGQERSAEVRYWPYTGNVVRHTRAPYYKNDTAMKNIRIGILLGTIAGIIDVIPMILQKLTWDANISAFTMWIVIGFFISTIDLKINPIIKGILLSSLVLLPSAILIGWSEPFTLLPIAIMTTILGGLLGFSFHKFSNQP